EDLINERAGALARERATSMAAAFRNNFAGAARTAGLTVQSSDLVARGTAFPAVGVSAPVETAAFALDAGAVSDPIATDNGTVVLRVADKQTITPEALALERDQLRTQISEQRRGEFFASYMTKAKQRMSIELKEETLNALFAAR